MGRVAAVRAVNRRGESSEARRGDRVIVTSGYWRVATLTLSAVTLALVGSFISCGGDSGGSLQPGAFLTNWQEATSAECVCQSERGWWGTGPSDECVRETSRSSQATKDCLKEVQDANDPVKEHFNCVKMKEVDLEKCLNPEDGPNCSEDDYSECFEKYYVAYAACTPMITPEVFQQLNDCF